MEKIGRNDPCLCGSGLKFKKCCETKKITNKKINAQILSSSEGGLASRIDTFGKFFQKPIMLESLPIEESLDTIPNDNAVAIEPLCDPCDKI